MGGYKIIYSCESNKTMSVNDLKEKAMEVKRVSDRLIAVKLRNGENILTTVSAYELQVVCKREERESVRT